MVTAGKDCYLRHWPVSLRMVGREPLFLYLAEILVAILAATVHRNLLDKSSSRWIVRSDDLMICYICDCKSHDQFAKSSETHSPTGFVMTRLSPRLATSVGAFDAVFENFCATEMWLSAAGSSIKLVDKGIANTETSAKEKIQMEIKNISQQPFNPEFSNVKINFYDYELIKFKKFHVSSVGSLLLPWNVFHRVKT